MNVLLFAPIYKVNFHQSWRTVVTSGWVFQLQEKFALFINYMCELTFFKNNYKTEIITFNDTKMEIASYLKARLEIMLWMTCWRLSDSSFIGWEILLWIRLNLLFLTLSISLYRLPLVSNSGNNFFFLMKMFLTWQMNTRILVFADIRFYMFFIDFYSNHTEYWTFFFFILYIYIKQAISAYILWRSGRYFYFKHIFTKWKQVEDIKLINVFS